MPMPPLVLITVFELKIETINNLLAKTYLFDCQYFWIVTSTDYLELPDSRIGGIPTHEYPVSDFRSPFIGKSLEELSVWLKEAPEQMVLDRTFFAVMDERTEKDGSILCCMAEEDDGGKVLSLRHTASGGALFLAGTFSSKFHEALEIKPVPDFTKDGE